MTAEARFARPPADRDRDREEEPGTARGRRLLVGLVRACRPRQWVKNGLVFVAPAVAGALTHAGGAARAAAAFAVFCLAAGGVYLLNDARDVEADRRHPRKRFRPLAAGVVPVRAAVALGVALILASGAIAAAVTWRLAVVVVVYLVLTTAYTLWLKHLAILDLAAVAGCHVIRAVAGATAVSVPVTPWFLAVVSLGALLLVTGKREAELRGESGSAGRATLEVYSASYLAQVRVMVSGAMIVTYSLWAVQTGSAAMSLQAASVVPFVLVVLRLNLLVHAGAGEEPEELALRDRPIQLLCLLLVGFHALGGYLG
ncbi:decaprenyl-phosphate phosphoribosyltransferase [Rhizohabitans arisaemae]|uniref:decaprenyl-phosphate phosphoribosyltransferase n=1 Tax=Rhizohabitans arisaemae TaxID=2720610 RepID=UPI0024B0CA03|nr:decaprenyl-phosphate phosphoribosyltransferase [Rhizohabitans arisaemae]